MASSKSSPGPHDRRPGVDRQRCIKLTKGGRRCTRWATQLSKLCVGHLHEVRGGPLEPEVLARKNTVRAVTFAQRTAVSSFVISEQAKNALSRLGIDPGRTDPKVLLLDTVRSAWQQAQVWEAMLASVPPEDWAHVGKVPIPGVLESAKGARIETMQRFLTEATKTAARTSKLAIDAGIEERLVRLAEEQSALIADTVRAGLIAGIGTLHLSPAAESAAIAAAVGQAATHLRALAAGQSGEVYEGIAVAVDTDVRG
jgi:hypothetical protein